MSVKHQKGEKNDMEYGFIRTSNGYYQPIVDDIEYGEPVPTAADAVLVLSELQERYSNDSQTR